MAGKKGAGKKREELEESESAPVIAPQIKTDAQRDEDSTLEDMDNGEEVIGLDMLGEDEEDFDGIGVLS